MQVIQNRNSEFASIEVLESTFLANGLSVLATDIMPIGDEGAFALFVEISAIELTIDLNIKANIYGEGQRFVDIGSKRLSCVGFAGYDTVVFRFFPAHGFRAKVVRIYAAGASCET